MAPRIGPPMLQRAFRGLGLASFVLFALTTVACGGGGASGILTGIGGNGGGGNNGGGGGGPTSSPIPPTPTPQPSVTTVPLVIGQALSFPTVSGFGGSVTFPSGSSPGSGVSITLQTALSVTSPPFPTFIDRIGPGQGANATSPMLTFSLSEAVTLSGALAVHFQLASACQPGAYYIALYQVGSAASTLIDSEAASCNGSTGGGHVAARFRRHFAARQQRSGFASGATKLAANTTYYTGVFFSPGAPTPTPSPTSVPPPVSRTIPMAAGSALSFPTVGGDGGSVTFPNGSLPITGNQITLTTALSLPDGYPFQIPQGFSGVGATAVAPWLTYKLSKTLNTPGGSNIIVEFSFTIFPPDGDYYLGIYDITQNPNVPLGTAPISIIPSLRSRGGPLDVKGEVRLRVRRGHPADQIPAGDKLYVGLFYLPNGISQNNQTVKAAGGLCTSSAGIIVPAFGGYVGCLDYAPNDSSGTIMSMTTAETDFTGGLTPPPKTGTPVLYVGLQLTNPPQLLSFHAQGGLLGSIGAASIITGGAYDLYGYDVSAPSGPVQFYQAGPIGAVACPNPSQGSCVIFPSPLAGVALTQDDQYVIEVVQD